MPRKKGRKAQEQEKAPDVSEEAEKRMKIGIKELDKYLGGFKVPSAILIEGPPGSGKSFLLQRIYNDYKDTHYLFLYKTPSFDKTALCEIYKKITGENIDHNLSEDLILASLKSRIKKDIIVMLDEAQQYTIKELEWIRVISDESNIKFILSIHKVNKDEILAKQHFQTRIYETIEMGNLDYNDVKSYVEHKVILAEGDIYLNYFSKKVYTLISEITKGNLRNINRLLHRYFMLLSEQFEKVDTLTIKDAYKYIELSALDLRMLERKSFLEKLFERLLIWK